MTATTCGAIVPRVGVLLACLLAACSAPPPESASPLEMTSAPSVQALASVLILSEPAMASVAIDGTDTGKKTPTKLTGLDAGRKLQVEVTLDGYETYRSLVTLAPGENRLPIPPLKKLGADSGSPIPPLRVAANSVGSIQAVSSDPNAKFFIGGVEIGTGSLNVRVVSSEPGATLGVEASQPSGGAVSDRAGGRTPAAEAPPVARAAPATAPEPFVSAVGTLRVSCSDPDAKLLVDGALIGRGSANVKVIPGRHSVRAVSASGDSKEASEEVEPGGVATKHLSLEATAERRAKATGGPGKLLFIVKPWAEVYINDQIIGTTPFAAREYPAGSYRVRLVNKDVGTQKTFTVKVEAGETTKVVQSMAGGE